MVEDSSDNPSTESLLHSVLGNPFRDLATERVRVLSAYIYAYSSSPQELLSGRAPGEGKAMSEGKPGGPEDRAGAIRHRIVTSSPPVLSLEPGVSETEVEVYRRCAGGLREGLLESARRREEGRNASASSGNTRASSGRSLSRSPAGTLWGSWGWGHRRTSTDRRSGPYCRGGGTEGTVRGGRVGDLAVPAGRPFFPCAHAISYLKWILFVTPPFRERTGKLNPFPPRWQGYELYADPVKQAKVPTSQRSRGE